MEKVNCYMNLMFKTIRALNSSLILLNISLEHLTKTPSLFRTACNSNMSFFKLSFVSAEFIRVCCKTEMSEKNCDE